MRTDDRHAHTGTHHQRRLGSGQGRRSGRWRAGPSGQHALLGVRRRPATRPSRPPRRPDVAHTPPDEGPGPACGPTARAGPSRGAADGRARHPAAAPTTSPAATTAVTTPATAATPTTESSSSSTRRRPTASGDPARALVSRAAARSAALRRPRHRRSRRRRDPLHCPIRPTAPPRHRPQPVAKVAPTRARSRPRTDPAGRHRAVVTDACDRRARPRRAARMAIALMRSVGSAAGLSPDEVEKRSPRPWRSSADGWPVTTASTPSASTRTSPTMSTSRCCGRCTQDGSGSRSAASRTSRARAGAARRQPLRDGRARLPDDPGGRPRRAPGPPPPADARGRSRLRDPADR